MTRPTFVATLVAVVALIAPGPAGAAVVNVETNESGVTTIRYVASDSTVDMFNEVDLDRDETEAGGWLNSVTQEWVVLRGFPDQVRLGTVPPDTCEPDGSHAVRCKANGVGIVEVDLGPGDDMAANSSSLTARFLGGLGDDALRGAGGHAVQSGMGEREFLEGGPGDDRLDGGMLNDVLRGGPGDDHLIGGTENWQTPDEASDDISGGDGRDEVHYDVYSPGYPVDVTLDGEANDGNVTELWGRDPENDNVRADVEEVYGTDAADRLTGSDGDEVLYGRGGADVIAGRGGGDVLDGGAASDTVSARDSRKDRVYCGEDAGGGADHDKVTGDRTLDEIFDCEDTSELYDPDVDGDGYAGGLAGPDCDDVDRSVHPGAPEVLDNGDDENCDGVVGVDFDRDRDGVNRPDDCDDANGAVHPGAPEVLDNDVDENCNGAKELDFDRDRDGLQRPADCDDGNAAVHPGAPEVLDNGVDENCSGGADDVNLDRDGDGIQRPADCDDDDPATHPGADDVRGNGVDEDCRGGPAPPPRLKASIVAEWRYEPFRFTRLVVKHVPAGSRIVVRCRGAGCPFRKRATAVRAGSRKLSPLGRLRGARLGRGATVAVRATKPRFDGVMRRFKVTGASKAPTSRDFCLPAGGGKPRRC